MRDIIINLSAWVVMFIGLAVAYDNRNALEHLALRTLSAFQPGHAVMIDGEAVLTRERSGHFSAHAFVNDTQVYLLVDTGSTDVALPHSDARRIGIDVSTLRYDRPVMTANGRAMVAAVTLDRVTIGDITIENVDASVAEPGRLGGALLGMSFLSRLSKFSIEGDKLLMRQ